jgi:arginase
MDSSCCNRPVSALGPGLPDWNGARGAGDEPDVGEHLDMLRIIGVPIDSIGIADGDERRGTERAPQALRSAGVVEALGAVDAGDLEVRITDRTRDHATGVVGWTDVSRTTAAVRAAVVEALSAGDLPVVIGGCCSLLPGALAGARDALGVVGLAYVDGHLDLYDGRTSPTGEAADMPVSVITGGGPDAWADLVAAPLTPVDGTVLLGARDRAEARSAGSIMPEDVPLSTELDPETLRDLGMERAGTDTEIALTTVAEAFWLHVDVDVLSTAAMPATDYLQEDGLSWDELALLLRPLGHSDGLVGFSLGCFNPDKCSTPEAPGRSSEAAALVTLLAEVLADPQPTG